MLCRNQALAPGEHAIGQVGGELAGAIQRREVPVIFVVFGALRQKRLQLLVSGILSRRYQRLRCLSERRRQGVGLFGFDRVADRGGPGVQSGPCFLYPTAPTTGERRKHRVGFVLLGQNLADRGDGLVPVLAHPDAEIHQAIAQCFIPAAFVNAVLLVEMDVGNVTVLAELQQCIAAIRKTLGVQECQWNAKLSQFPGQGVGVFKNKAYPGGRPVVFLPLLRGDYKTRAHRFS